MKSKYFHTVGSERWVFQSVDAEGKSVRLLHCKDFPIKRHIKLKAEANPFDPNDELYFEQRQIRHWKENILGVRKLRTIWERQTFGVMSAASYSMTTTNGISIILSEGLMAVETKSRTW